MGYLDVRMKFIDGSRRAINTGALTMLVEQNQIIWKEITRIPTTPMEDMATAMVST